MSDISAAFDDTASQRTYNSFISFAFRTIVEYLFHYSFFNLRKILLLIFYIVGCLWDINGDDSSLVLGWNSASVFDLDWIVLWFNSRVNFLLCFL